MNWYLLTLKNYTNFSGRSRRKEFWMFTLLNMIFSFILQFIDFTLIGTYVFSGIYGLLILIPSLALSFRRLHDINKSGWWLLLSLIPIIGTIVLIVFFCLDSQVGENQYGKNPKE